MRSNVASPTELLPLSTPALCVDGVTETVVVAVLVLETTAATIVGSSGSNVARDVGSSMVTRFCVLGVGSVALDMMPPAPAAALSTLRLPLMVGGGGNVGAADTLSTKSTYGLCCSGT